MAVVTFLSDYGLGDDFVGVCHGVIARIAPEARVIDVTHGIARHDVRTGALVLRTTFADVPAGALLLYEDGYRTLALAVNRGSARAQLGLELDAEVLIAPSGR